MLARKLGALVLALLLAACGDGYATYQGASGALVTGPQGGTSPQYHGLSVAKGADVLVEFYRPDNQPAEWLGDCKIHEIWVDAARNRSVVLMSGRSGIPGQYYFGIVREHGRYKTKVVLHRFCYPEYWRDYGYRVSYDVHVTIYHRWRPFAD